MKTIDDILNNAPSEPCDKCGRTLNNEDEQHGTARRADESGDGKVHDGGCDTCCSCLIDGVDGTGGYEVEWSCTSINYTRSEGFHEAAVAEAGIDPAAVYPTREAALTAIDNSPDNLTGRVVRHHP